LPDLVVSLLSQSGITAERLTLEITEDSIMTDPGRAIVVLQQLREAGVAISIDDFGTGYSSLAYLRDLCANEVKIDRSFVSGGTSAENDLAVVRAATQLSHSLGLSVVAEGVESADQVRLLADIGVDVLQGYHILPPRAGRRIARLGSTSATMGALLTGRPRTHRRRGGPAIGPWPPTI
jgi:EAL domain-containing protein (putative c-di-GMP-specific phosphodiesterase class I)